MQLFRKQDLSLRKICYTGFGFTGNQNLLTTANDLTVRINLNKYVDFVLLTFFRKHHLLVQKTLSDVSNATY